MWNTKFRLKLVMEQEVKEVNILPENKEKAIKRAGRGRDGTFAQVELETGEEILPEEAVRRLKQGRLKTDYHQEENE